MNKIIGVESNEEIEFISSYFRNEITRRIELHIIDESKSIKSIILLLFFKSIKNLKKRYVGK